METTNIINAINSVAEKIFKSVESEVFKNLDDLLVINEKIIKTEPLKTLLIKDGEKALVLLLSSFVIFFAIYYVGTRIIAMYNGEGYENGFKTIAKIILCSICSISSIYICEQVLLLNSSLTEVIASIGSDITGEKICFESLREIVLDLDKYMGQEALSVDGIIKGVISFGATTILISFAVRYVTIIFLIFVSPIAIMCASSIATEDIFKNWLKLFLVNLFIQNIVLIILMLPLSFKNLNDSMFKIILVGTIYLLYRINNFSKEFLGNISSKVIRR